MSDSIASTSALGKRDREDETLETSNGQEAAANGQQDGNAEESSDEDDGPMPLPASAAQAAPKKKRKGRLCTRSTIWTNN